MTPKTDLAAVEAEVYPTVPELERERQIPTPPPPDPEEKTQ